MIMCACYLWVKAKQYPYFQLRVRATLFSFRLIDFIVHFFFSLVKGSWEFFSVYTLIYSYSAYIHIYSFFYNDFSRSHSTQINDKSLLSLSPEFQPQLQKIKLFPACSSRRGTTPFSNKQGSSTVIYSWDRIKDIFAIWRKHSVTMGLFWKFKRWHPGCISRTRFVFQTQWLYSSIWQRQMQQDALFPA